MAKLPLLPEAAGHLCVASGSPEQQCNGRAFGPGDMFFSSGEGVSVLLPTVRPIRLRAMRFAVGSGARLPRMLRERARRYRRGG